MVEIVELVGMEMGISISYEQPETFSGATVGDLKQFIENRTESAV